MSANKGHCTASSGAGAEVLMDIETLTAQQLREKYRPEANSHRSMMQRRAQGRVVHPAWEKSFGRFLADMGQKPSPSHSLDRIDNDNPMYGPGLCRWATKTEQTQNRSNSVVVEWNGKRLTIAEFAQQIGRSYHWVHYRLSQGQSAEEIAAASNFRQDIFVPPRLNGNTAAIEKWRHGYARWRSRVMPSRRKYAKPEVYEIVTLGADYAKSKAWLEAKGYFELAGAEYEAAQALEETPFGRMYRLAPSAIDDAAVALVRTDIEVARKLLRGPRILYWELWRWGEWFMGQEAKDLS